MSLKNIFIIKENSDDDFDNTLKSWVSAVMKIATEEYGITDQNTLTDIEESAEHNVSEVYGSSEGLQDPSEWVEIYVDNWCQPGPDGSPVNVGIGTGPLGAQQKLNWEK